ncbi:hypothetical protein SDJN02_08277, partial [Cucurbita argyrosperma subsp. argyrosperma]
TTLSLSCLFASLISSVATAVRITFLLLTTPTDGLSVQDL